MSEEKATVAIVLVACLVFGFIGLVVAEDVTRKNWQAECVKRGFAEYNQKTGEWQWKEENGKQP